MSVIEVTNLTKYYGKARGIVDVSFNVEQGEIYGFIGPNGAGKSTTIRLFLSLIYPSSGGTRAVEPRSRDRSRVTADSSGLRGTNLSGLTPERRAW